jgi:hypothetical protein
MRRRHEGEIRLALFAAIAEVWAGGDFLANQDARTEIFAYIQQPGAATCGIGLQTPTCL